MRSTSDAANRFGTRTRRVVTYWWYVLSSRSEYWSDRPVDSTAEDYFISWLCLLSPHVRATPDYTESPYFDWAQQKDIYLDPDSPLVSSLTFPDGFSIAITLWRVDLPPNLDLGSNDFITELLRIFTAPLLSANYKTMMVSRRSELSWIAVNLSR
jgi:hypothetical protein